MDSLAAVDKRDWMYRWDEMLHSPDQYGIVCSTLRFTRKVLTILWTQPANATTHTSLIPFPELEPVVNNNNLQGPYRRNLQPTTTP